ncbi:hypothetical protein lerEdw1_020418 [Lerista edwardsae]|nr:hypothetical protein lerEdw1_020418 [Lerista edwardsae]
MLRLSPLRPGRALRWAATSCGRSTDAAPPALRRPDQPLPACSPAQRRQQDPARADPQPPGPRRGLQGLGRAEALALREAVLVAALRSRLFYEAPQERFVRRLADWLPAKADGLAPSTMTLIAKYVARHRLREPPLLDSIAAFLLRRIDQLDSKVIQKLVFPFSRVNYRPPNHAQLFPQLEAALTRNALPLATVNVLMSLVQLRHFPQPLLQKVFSPAFLSDVTSSPCGWIMRRYLSLLDMAVALEVHEYDGPRLDPKFRVQMFNGTLTADEANGKYSFKGLVAEALQQLLGERYFRQDEVLPQGYCTDFLLWISASGAVLPLSGTPCFSKAGARLERVQTPTAETPNWSPLKLELLGSLPAGSVLSQKGSPPPLHPQDLHGCLSKEPSSLSSCAQTSRPTDLSNSSLGDATHIHCPIQSPGDGQLLPTDTPASPHLSSMVVAAQGGPEAAAEEIHRVVLSVNDKWHYCQNSDVLVGSRAMCNRHLRLLGYHVVQLPYMELEQASGIEEAKHYLCQRLKELRS